MDVGVIIMAELDVGTLQVQLDEARTQLEELKALPDSPELTDLKNQLEETVCDLKELIQSMGGVVVDTDATNTAPTTTAGSLTLSEPCPPGLRILYDSTLIPDPPTCDALYSHDGNFYPATVVGVTEDGRFVVQFEGYGDYREVVRSAGIRARDPGSEYRAGSSYTNNTAERSSYSAHTAVPTEIPARLQIRPEDDEKTREIKRKKLKSIKSKIRVAKLNETAEEQRNSWQSFKSGKGLKKPTGVVKTKSKSMFSVGEGIGAKVGVTGSGQGMTQAVSKTKHVYRDANTGADS